LPVGVRCGNTLLFVRQDKFLFSGAAGQENKTGNYQPLF
jgi:hypothetical protein